MPYKLGGKKPQMNNETSMKTSAAMYASKTSMYGKKPMTNGGPGDDEKKKKATTSIARETVFPKSEPGFAASKLTADIVSGKVKPSRMNDAEARFIEENKSNPVRIYAKITGTTRGYERIQ